MRIRHLDASHASAWHALRKRAVAEHPEAFLTSPAEEERTPLETVSRRLGSPASEAFVLGAFLEGAMVGMLGVLREAHEKARHKALVWGVYVAPEARRRGVGRALFEAAIERARDVGIERLNLAVKVDNAAARGLYQSMGFVSWGIERDSFRVDGRPIDEEHMVLVTSR